MKEKRFALVEAFAMIRSFIFAAALVLFPIGFLAAQEEAAQLRRPKMTTQELADWIDTRFTKAYAEAGVTPAPLVDDATFLRRISLDLQGRIPTVAQIRDFTAAESSFKRPDHVDRLLGLADRLQLLDLAAVAHLEVGRRQPAHRRAVAGDQDLDAHQLHLGAEDGRPLRGRRGQQQAGQRGGHDPKGRPSAARQTRSSRLRARPWGPKGYDHHGSRSRAGVAERIHVQTRLSPLLWLSLQLDIGESWHGVVIDIELLNRGYTPLRVHALDPLWWSRPAGGELALGHPRGKSLFFEMGHHTDTSPHYWPLGGTRALRALARSRRRQLTRNARTRTSTSGSLVGIAEDRGRRRRRSARTPPAARRGRGRHRGDRRRPSGRGSLDPARRAVVERDLHEVANRDDPDDLVAEDDGKVAEAAVDHE